MYTFDKRTHLIRAADTYGGALACNPWVANVNIVTACGKMDALV